MACELFFSRDTKIYVQVGAFYWEIPVLDGYAFSQNTNTTEVTLNEMSDASGNSRRGRKVFNDSYAPAEWSFSTYARPFISAGAGAGTADDQANHHAVEEVLWAQFVGAGTYSGEGVNAFDFDNITAGLSNMTISFANSNKTTLGEFTLYVVLGAAQDADGNYTGATNVNTYKISRCCVNEASIDFDIDGIATINWSGMGAIIEDVANFDLSGAKVEGAADTDNFIRNRLTALTMTAADTTTFPGAASNGVYNVVLTGGNITLSNNITFLTPETLGVVNQPLGHVTGTRSITGNFTCYLDREVGHSADLFEDLIEASSVITNEFDLTFAIGGTTGTPRVEIGLPQAHLKIPQHSIEDVISLQVDFDALSSDMCTADEVDITYIGV